MRARLGAVAAIARRDWQMQRSYHFQLGLRLLQTLFAVGTLSLTSQLVTDAPSLEPYGGDYFSFALIGVMMLAFVTAGLNTFGSRLSEEQSLGTLEVVLASPIDLGTFLLGSLVIPFAQALITVSLYLGVAVVFFGERFPWDGVLLSIPIAVLTLGAFSSIGIFSATFIVLTKRGDPIAVVTAQLSTFLAGAFFPVALLPAGLQWAAHLFPSYYSLQGLRAVLISDEGVSGAIGPILALTGFCVVLIPISLVCFRWAVRTAMHLGTLVTY